MRYGEEIRQQQRDERERQRLEQIEHSITEANKHIERGPNARVLEHCAIALAEMGLLSDTRKIVKLYRASESEMRTWPSTAQILWDHVSSILEEAGAVREVPLMGTTQVVTGHEAAEAMMQIDSFGEILAARVLDDLRFAGGFRTTLEAQWDRQPMLIGKPQTQAEMLVGLLETTETAASTAGIVESVKDTYRVESDEFEHSWLYQEWERRVDNGQDMVTVITAAGERGVGKTVLALKLGKMFDRTGDGMGPSNVTTHPAELRDMYVDLPKGASLLLDEAAVAIGNRSAMTNDNRSVKDAMNQGRLEEKMLFICAPTSGHIDKFVAELSAVWIRVTGLGEAVVHEYDYKPYQEEIHTPKKEHLKWWDLDSDDLEAAHDEISEQKRASIRGEGESKKKISADEVDAQLEAAREEATAETRDELLCSIYNDTDLTQKEIGDAVGLSRSRVADILSEA